MEKRNGKEITVSGTGTGVLTLIKTVDLSNADGFTLMLKNTGVANALTYELRFYPNAAGTVYDTYDSGSIATSTTKKLINVKDIAYSKAIILVSGVTTYLLEGFRLNNQGG
jgi:hypothetical protein